MIGVLLLLPAALATRYVALGSSYASGPGLGHQSEGTLYACRQSNDNYPHKVQDALKFDEFKDMSCSGATLENVLYGGQHKNLEPQIDSLNADTKLVTLTAGGNDVYYVGDLIYAGQGRGISDNRPWETMRSRMETTIDEIHRRSPNARVFVVDYLTDLRDGVTCDSIGIEISKVHALYEVQQKLRSITKEVVEEKGAELIDVAGSSEYHTACDSDPWVLGKDGKPMGFHPNNKGTEVVANAIINSWKYY